MHSYTVNILNFARNRNHKHIHANIHERLTLQYLVPVSLFTHSPAYTRFLASSKLYTCIDTLRSLVMRTNKKAHGKVNSSKNK